MMGAKTFEIQGMSCQHCIRRVSGALNAVPGVRVDTVEIGRARVTVPDEWLSSETIIKALADAGYDAREMA